MGTIILRFFKCAPLSSTESSASFLFQRKQKSCTWQFVVTDGPCVTHNSLLIINNIMTELSLFTLHSFFTIDRTYIELLMTQLLLATRSETQRPHLFAQTADKSTSAKYIVYSTHPLPNIISDILSNMEKLTLLTTNMEMYKHPRHFPG